MNSIRFFYGKNRRRGNCLSCPVTRVPKRSRNSPKRGMRISRISPQRSSRGLRKNRRKPSPNARTCSAPGRHRSNARPSMRMSGRRAETRKMCSPRRGSTKGKTRSGSLLCPISIPKGKPSSRSVQCRTRTARVRTTPIRWANGPERFAGAIPNSRTRMRTNSMISFWTISGNVERGPKRNFWSA